MLAEVEWEHERYFRLEAASHHLAALLPVWSAPDDKATIRQTFILLVNGGQRVHT